MSDNEPKRRRKLWKYVAFIHSDKVVVEPLAADTAARALEAAADALRDQNIDPADVRAETFTRIICSTPECRGHASSDAAGRYVCDSCAKWFLPELF